MVAGLAPSWRLGWSSDLAPGGAGRTSRFAQLARMWVLPARVIAPRCSDSPAEFSPQVRPLKPM